METVDTRKRNSGTLAFALKAIVAGIVIFAGIGGGVYVGLSASGKSAFTGLRPENLQNTTNLNIGDTFPDYTLMDLKSGEQMSVSEMRKRGPLLLAYVSNTCGACESMATFWRKRKVLEKVRGDIQVAMVYDKDDFIENGSEENILDTPGAMSLSASRADERDEDGILATPSLVGIGRDGRIKFVITGFSRDLNADFINEYL